MSKTEIIPIRAEEDVVKSRQAVRANAVAIGLNLVEQTKIVTAASEIARNTLIYGGGGTLLLEVVEKESRAGLRLTFEDHGPGIPDIKAAMRDGFTTGSGLGLGLSGTQRLAHEFEIQSEPDQSKSDRGTRVTLTHWKR